MSEDQLKRAVAQAAVDYVLPMISSESIVGIGTGSTANFFIDLLSAHKQRFAGTVASSDASAKRLVQLGIPVLELNDVDKLAVYIDGADEATADLMLIKGGGAALTREKIVAAAADCFICIADQSKWVNKLGAFPLPVEIIPMARTYVSNELRKLGGKPVYRENVVTDNGGHILDVHQLDIPDPRDLETRINQITGVISNGLFALRPADVLLLGRPNGVETIARPRL